MGRQGASVPACLPGRRSTPSPASACCRCCHPQLPRRRRARVQRPRQGPRLRARLLHRSVPLLLLLLPPPCMLPTAPLHAGPAQGRACPVCCRRLDRRGLQSHRAHHHLHQKRVRRRHRRRQRALCRLERCPPPSPARAGRGSCLPAELPRLRPLLPLPPPPTGTTWVWHLRVCPRSTSSPLSGSARPMKR